MLNNQYFSSMNLDQKTPKIAVIGLGYVGLPLAIAFAEHFSVLGYDINSKRVHELLSGSDVTDEADLEELQQALHSNLRLSSNTADLEDCNTYIVTVPTPVTFDKMPDLSFLLSASKTIGQYLNKGDLVIYESTVYPGCTEEDCVPVLEAESGLVFNTDFFCGYSPERINPGDRTNTLTKIAKVTSGSTQEVAQYVDQLYQKIISAGTHLASSIKVAEASKAIENAQRDINISFVNELSLIFDKIGIDTNEVLQAAATKWNFLPFKPGLVGGHCISVDPYYLMHKSKLMGYEPQVLLSGRQVNDTMPLFVANKLIKLLSTKGIDHKGASCLVLGITFKENCPDIRNSKIPEVAAELEDFGVKVSIFDVHASKEEVKKEFKLDLIDELETYDAILLAVAHDEFKTLDYQRLKNYNHSVIFDLKGVLPQDSVDARL